MPDNQAHSMTRSAFIILHVGLLLGGGITSAGAGPWEVVNDPNVGTMLVQTLPEAGGGQHYAGITAMCFGGKLDISLTAARRLQKPDVYMSEGGFGDTRFVGAFQKISDGGPQIISLSSAASTKLYRVFVKTEADARKAGATDATVNLGPGGTSGGNMISVTNFTALSRGNLACIK